MFILQGNWVFLANCHLSLSWMPQLDKLVEQLQVEEPHPEFRLWLSSSPHPEFPIAILQTGIKMTTEPPKVCMSNINPSRTSMLKHKLVWPLENVFVLFCWVLNFNRQGLFTPVRKRAFFGDCYEPKNYNLYIDGLKTEVCFLVTV